MRSGMSRLSGDYSFARSFTNLVFFFFGSTILLSFFQGHDEKDGKTDEAWERMKCPPVKMAAKIRIFPVPFLINFGLVAVWSRWIK